MSGRTRVTLADGRRVVGYRKTLARRARPIPLHHRPDFTVALVLTNGYGVRAGQNLGIMGIRSFPNGRVECVGKSREWCLGQMRQFLARMGIPRHQAVLTRADEPGPADSAPLRKGYARTIWIEVGPAPGTYFEKCDKTGILSMRMLPLFCDA